MISIIIPCLNEERILPILLKDIKRQTRKDYEVIIGDAGSKDGTVKIAKQLGCSIACDGGKPSVSRNAGARKAKGDILVFLDADASIQPDFLETAIGEMEERKLDVCTPRLEYQSRKFSYRIMAVAGRLYMKMAQYFQPNCSAASGIIIKAKLHRKINGFDTQIKFGEDSEYILRASKQGKFRTLKKAFVNSSIRRFEKVGVARLCMFYMKMTLLQAIGFRKKVYCTDYAFDIYKGKRNKIS